MKMPLTLSLLLNLAACATHPAEMPPPQGRDWSTQHQGYTAAHLSVSTSRQGGREVTTTTRWAKQKLFSRAVAQPMKPRLVAGRIATSDALEGDAVLAAKEGGAR
ncbi:MAG: hypothetical protein IT384_24845 [Deltaproteobacteria bacterium]|nr:hypothetical protein [Deltaproteobacteria bacterium]